MTASVLRLEPPKTLQEHVAQELLAAMGRRRVSQRRFAAALGIDNSTLSRRLRGEQPMTVDFIEQACGLLGVSPRSLFGWQGEPTPPPQPGDVLPAGSWFESKRGSRTLGGVVVDLSEYFSHTSPVAEPVAA